MQNTFRTIALKTGNEIEFLISKSRSFHKLTVEGKNEFLNFSLLHIKELMFCPDLKGIDMPALLRNVVKVNDVLVRESFLKT
jgi:hypothetical protein